MIFDVKLFVGIEVMLLDEIRHLLTRLAILLYEGPALRHVRRFHVFVLLTQVL